MKTMKTARTALLATVLLALAPMTRAQPAQGALADAYSSDVASVWMDLLYDIVKSESTAP